jgi:ribonuclease HII
MTRSTTPLIFAPPNQLVIGIDEAGRGCLAGPVTAGAALLHGTLSDLADSKALSPQRRARALPGIQANSTWAVAHASHEEIDAINILQATFLAMTRALDGVLAQLPPGSEGEVWVDGNRAPPIVRTGWTFVPIIKGDATHAPVSAASILAKETRDALMVAYATTYPGYGFERHMSYGTADHLTALDALGPCAIHRLTFAPVRKAAEHWQKMKERQLD